MAFNTIADAIDWKLFELPWEADNDKLILKGDAAAAVHQLIKKEPGVCDRIAILVKQANFRLAQLYVPGKKKRTINVLASMAPQHNHREDTMTSTPLSTNMQPPEGFVWFGGVIVPALRPILDRMESSDEPTGLVQPTTGDESVIRTIQWAINKASVDLFGFNALNMDDMREAIQRDTSDDWYPEDLERKRQLYQQADHRFEQTARIRTKTGWMLIHFQCERTGVGDLVLSRGRQVSEMVERPELLTLV